MAKQHRKKKDDGDFDGAVNQLMWVYLLVSASLSAAWGLGTLGFSFLWVFIVIGFLFVIWRTKLTNIVRRHLSKEEQRIHRKRALRQSETVEWFNFLLNRWWVFSSQNLEEVIKKKIDERLTVVKPSFLDHLELLTFSFGEQTPAVKYVRVFEYSEGVPRGHKPVSWVSVHSPPTGLDRMSTYQVVLEADIDTSCEDFKMVYRARVGGRRVGLSFDTAVENLNIKGNLQVVLQMSMDAPFPHVTKATVSFTELPEVWFSVRVLKTLQIMEVPLIKSWLHANVMEGLTRALVDPGKIDIPITSAGPIQLMQSSKQPQKLAQGVLTIVIKGLPVKEADPEEVRYAKLRVADKKRQTYDVLPTDEWEDICSFFVYNLSKDKMIVKSKCRRLLSNVTMDYHEIDLASLPLEMENNVTTSFTNKDSSVFELKLQYSPLTFLDMDVTVEDPPPRQGTEVAGVMYVCVHSATNVMAGDVTGTSDPYCVVFCDRRRVMTTPFIPRTRDPRWERYVEFFVGDVTKASLSFYVFDWDGTNTIDDDFLGSAHLSLKEDEGGVIKKNLTLGYNKRSEGYVADPSFGMITVSVIFRPVPSVAKSEKYRLQSSSSPQDYLYREDLVSPASVPMASRPSCHFSTQEDSRGGGPGDPSSRKTSAVTPEFPQDKLFVDLTILQARDLMGMDRNGLSDPYCEVSVGDKKLYKTAVKKNTLFPKWNESTTFDVADDATKLEINVFDKDVFSKDFLGKVSLNVEKLKEISHKGSSEWLKLQRTKSGQIQIKCVITSKETIGKRPGKLSRQSSSRSKTDSEVFTSSPELEKRDQTTPVISEESLPKDITPVHASHLESPIIRENQQEVQSSTLPRDTKRRSQGKENPRASSSSLKRSASDVNMKKANGQSSKSHSTVPSTTGGMKHSESTNSFTALHPGGDAVSITSSAVNSTVEQDILDKRPDVKNKSKHKYKDGSILGAERMYSVSGRVMRARGLKLTDGAQVYCKVRVEQPGHRLRLMSGSRVIAKSALVKASNPVLNTPFEIDRGAGVSVDTNLVLDLKEDHKEHVAQRSFALRELFTDCEESGDVQQWLPLSNGVEIELYLTQGKPNPRMINRQKNPLFKTWSFRRSDKIS